MRQGPGVKPRGPAVATAKRRERARDDIVIEWTEGFHVGRVPRVGADPESPAWQFRFRREEDAGVMREWEVRFEDDAEWVAFFEHPTWVAVDGD
jgi:hypothetical protein